MGDRALYIRHLFMTTDDDARLKKLRFRAWRRGFREADLILGPFADRHVPDFSGPELDWFEGLLDQPDQDVYAWIIGTMPTPPAYDCEIMNRIKAFRLEVHGDGARGG
ncbi:succinate dehydrogenase assembly factor 2 [Phenylobacterium sp.]|uniref:FAD assembly factor SdhE n=1 Tax=Phenylobacterium sp. TaxID=1871053 RepID=UPI003565A978